MPPRETGHPHERHHEATGKIKEGHERVYRSREAEVEALARYAWEERVVIGVVTEAHRPDEPARIILHRAPPQPRHHRP
jgi:hypothetical protein